MPLPTAHWAALGPHWKALGFKLLNDASTSAAAASHPAAVRYCLAEATRSALAGF
jgi:hypothetical protein